MHCYDPFCNYFGDLHNHCNITFGHGSVEDAIKNARERLDFCSVTGHAHWTDIPSPNERIRHIVEFHRKGFERLKSSWPHVLTVIAAANKEGSFVTFPGFEILSSRDGDRTILYRDDGGELLYADSITALEEKAQRLRTLGRELIVFPHHIAYMRGRRGLNWDVFNPQLAPVVEILSLHGCSESDETPRPMLTPMGPADSESTMACGLARGHFFGVIGGTDHHSGHPGSYGSGLTGIWAEELTREGIWEALLSRRTYALTGDRIRLKASINDSIMGSIVPPSRERSIRIRVKAGGAIDYVDIVKNNRLLRRFCQYEIQEAPDGPTRRTKLFLEVGWGHRDRQTDWEIDFGLSAGKIIEVEPRFRGHLILSPLDGGDERCTYFSSWREIDDRMVHFRTTTWGNPNPYTNTCQGMCLEVEAPPDTEVLLRVNGRRLAIPLERVFRGTVTGSLFEEIESEAWCLHRAPLLDEYRWDVTHTDQEMADHSGGREGARGCEEVGVCEGDVYYIRVRQRNDQWAYSSPFKVLREE